MTRPTLSDPNIFARLNALSAEGKAKIEEAWEAELADAFDYWKRSEADAKTDSTRIAWETENRAYNALVRAARALGYHPNNTETCAQWAARRLNRSA